MKQFLDEDFLLQTETARLLYHSYAAKMPIYDYHCHLPVKQIADDHCFGNITQAWLYGDHYKWRAMRSNGVDERFCTGDATDEQKFQAWAETVPHCLCNPLYHWTHLELKRYFGVSGIVLNGQTAKKVYQACTEKLASPEYSTRNLLRMQNVKLVCTTEDPCDSLDHHQALAQQDLGLKVHTAWRPDKAMACEDVTALNAWIDTLAGLTDVDVKDYDSYLEAITKRHGYFHDNGCRLSDHGIEEAYAEDFTVAEIKTIFASLRKGEEVSRADQLKFKSALMLEFGRMDAAKGWVQQLHLGALRNNNTRLYNSLGPDTGFDSIGDWNTAQALSKYLNRLDTSNELAKTILYNLNPRDNELMVTMIGNFQDGSVPGKMQFGSGWWFLDQKVGMENQIRSLSVLGLLSRFVGMLTDSRSFLSYPRHEYFRRILCNLLGNDVENGELPNDLDLLGNMVQDICFNNAKAYFPMECD